MPSLKNIVSKVCLLLLILLAALNAMNRIQITVDCPICKQPCLTESVLCRFADRFAVNFAHYSCVERNGFPNGDISN